jgi:hypothetical protein
VGDVPLELNSPDDHLAFDRSESTFLFFEGDSIFIRSTLLATMSP